MATRGVTLHGWSAQDIEALVEQVDHWRERETKQRAALEAWQRAREMRLAREKMEAA